ncbi:creatininase family protein [candidate division KSB1 bacterium]|nr:creatininase family protein [candidate division KSB1 bacterium]
MKIHLEAILANPLWGKYEQLRPAQIAAIRARTPIAYLPWGALEWHSYHAPIGLDGIKAHGLCEALAKETGGVVLPAVYVGTDTIKPYKGFHHTIEHNAETVTKLCLEFLQQLADEDFKVIVLVTGHYGGCGRSLSQQPSPNRFVGNAGFGAAGRRISQESCGARRDFFSTSIQTRIGGFEYAAGRTRNHSG